MVSAHLAWGCYFHICLRGFSQGLHFRTWIIRFHASVKKRSCRNRRAKQTITMKKLSLMIVALLLSAIVFAQPKSVTKFLGIPIDGSKAEMIQKLKEKGYTYNSKLDCLEGEFNGRDVQISVVTNNSKVYRILVQDAIPSSEGDIKIRFNTLCQQFEANGKYWSPSNYTLSEEEDISYEMTVHNKRYQAAYYQFNVLEGMQEYMKANPEASSEDATTAVLEQAMKHSVWFMINQWYGRYTIAMFYDNEYNQANGDDL